LGFEAGEHSQQLFRMQLRVWIGTIHHPSDAQQTEACAVIFIFGWEKQAKPLGEVGKLHCFECKRVTPWLAAEEAEWVTIFFLRVLKFSNKHRLRCNGCGEVLALTPEQFKQVDRVMRQRDSIAGTEIHAALTECIEKEQLAGKTPTQIRFIRESLRRAEEDRRTASDAQSKR
jgi:hypothetical protein